MKKACLCATALVLAACGGSATGEEGEGAVGTSVAALVTTPVTYVCSSSTAFRLTVDVDAPASVAPSEVFPATVRIRDFFIAPTPFPIIMNSSQEVLATNATPPSSTVAFPELNAPQGQPILDLGSGTVTLTASASVGSPVELHAGAFDYTLVNQSPPFQTVTGHCVPPDSTPSLIATIPIVSVPHSKNDCKNGGWQHLTDDLGNAFKNQGACINFSK